MKYLFALWLILNFVLVACDKDDDLEPVVFPETVQAVINELRQNEGLCDICNVEIIEYKGKTYYNLYCGHWSCSHCEFYDEEGVKVDWGQDIFQDFFDTHEIVRIIPMCQD